ncbi:hypothetical protein [Streptomyces sp. NBC_00005]|uniref:hypothetical protein n=1 Tax=Streptomyces sp. NBC_00005 TaxID=2903609 RepID=UPI00324C76C5
MPPVRPTRRVLLAGGLGAVATVVASPGAVANPLSRQSTSAATASVPLHLAGPTGPAPWVRWSCI